MVTPPRVSFVIPAYNAADTLEAATRSVLAQAGVPDDVSLEVVISDDGSTDTTRAIARRLAAEDPRVRTIEGPNGGCSVARNRAVEVSRGEFFCLLDADDELAPEYLAAMSAFADAKPGLDIYSCNATRRLGNGRTEPFFSGRDFARETSWTLDDLIPMDRIYVSALVRKDLWERVGGFRSDLRYAEDYDFWLRTLASGATHRYLPSALGVAVVRSGSKSRNRIPHAEAQIRIFTDLAASPGLTERQRRLCSEKIEALELRIDRVELEERLQAGAYARARRTYLRLRPAYLSGTLYYIGLVLMLVSPRLYAAAYRLRSA